MFIVILLSQTSDHGAAWGIGRADAILVRPGGPAAPAKLVEIIDALNSADRRAGKDFVAVVNRATVVNRYRQIDTPEAHQIPDQVWVHFGGLLTHAARTESKKLWETMPWWSRLLGTDVLPFSETGNEPSDLAIRELKSILPSGRIDEAMRTLTKAKVLYDEQGKLEADLAELRALLPHYIAFSQAIAAPDQERYRAAALDQASRFRNAVDADLSFVAKPLEKAEQLQRMKDFCTKYKRRAAMVSGRLLEDSPPPE